MSDTPPPKRFNTRGFTSLLLTLAFLAVSFSGIILYVTPKGQVAHWTGWTMLGLGKEDWAGLHMNVALLFLIVGVVHLVLNWTRFWSYLKKKTGGLHLKRELAVATIVAAVVVAGTLYHVPPLSTIVDANDAIQRGWARHAIAAPVPHAEQLRLDAFADEINLSLDDLVNTLEEEGFDVKDATVTIQELAQQKELAPSEIFEVLRARFPEIGHRPGRGQGMGRGQGQGRGRGQGPGNGAGRRHDAAGGE